MTLTMDEVGLRQLVETFYGRIRKDEVLGPIFNDAVDDWPHHFTQLTAFWTSVMMGSGRYKGQPVPAHAKHKSRIEPWMFDRWLGIWKDTTDELMEPGAAAALQDKAARIAESLKLALFFRLRDPARPEPYKKTAIWDQDTLPDAIRNEHRTKEGTWGLLRLLEGSATLVFTDDGRKVPVAPGKPGVIPPKETHYVALDGPARMQVEFYREHPLGAG